MIRLVLELGCNGLYVIIFTTMAASIADLQQLYLLTKVIQIEFDDWECGIFVYVYFDGSVPIVILIGELTV